MTADSAPASVAVTGSTAGLLTLASGQFLMALDSSVMNVSIATVADDLGTTVTGIQTAITLYTLMMASLMITGGKVGQLVGRKRAFAIGCAIYGVGSAITAVAPNLAVPLIGWSILEGVGAALLMPAIVALVASFFFQYLLQSGLFFVVPLFLSVALGLSAIETGVRILPLSAGLLLAALGVPRAFPHASPRRVVRVGFAFVFAGLLLLLAGLEIGVGPEVVTWPLLLAGLGIGALASQLGSVTVSAVPDDQSAEVGGLQNSITFLGASIGTALSGAVLVSALSSSFLSGIESNPDVPEQVAASATVELSAGVPFVSDKALAGALDEAGVTEPTASAVLDVNEASRIAGLRNALAAPVGA
jgi:hypothetical protein